MIKEIIETLNASLNTTHEFVFVTDRGEANLLFADVTFPATVLYLERDIELRTLQSGLARYRYSRLEIAFLNLVDVDSTADQIYTIQQAEINAANQMLNLIKSRPEWELVPNNTEQAGNVVPLPDQFDASVCGCILRFTNLVLQGSNVCA